MSPADIVQLSQGLFHYLQREILFPETNIKNALILNKNHIQNVTLTKWLQQKERLQQVFLRVNLVPGKDSQLPH